MISNLIMMISKRQWDKLLMKKVLIGQ